MKPAYLLAIVDGRGATFTYAPATGKLACTLSDAGSLYGKMLQWRDKGYTISPLANAPHTGVQSAWLCFPPGSDHDVLYTLIEQEFARRATIRSL